MRIEKLEKRSGLFVCAERRNNQLQEIKEITMTTVSYLAAATNRQYSPESLGFIGSDLQKNTILEVARILGVSAGAIAGAMVEENDAYSNSPILNKLLDTYALSGIDPVVAAVSLQL